MGVLFLFVASREFCDLFLRKRCIEKSFWPKRFSIHLILQWKDWKIKHWNWNYFSIVKPNALRVRNTKSIENKKSLPLRKAFHWLRPIKIDQHNLLQTLFGTQHNITKIIKVFNIINLAMFFLISTKYVFYCCHIRTYESLV